jgi:anti-anti-sigma factor
MTTTTIPGIDVGSFSARTVETAPGALHVSFKGEADSTALPAFEQFLTNLHAAAQTAKAKEITLDVREVAFMNSSSFTKLITWINRVKELAVDTQYRIRIQSNQNVLWQRRSLQALQAFALELVTIE